MFLHHSTQILMPASIIIACQTKIWAESIAEGNDKPINNKLVVLTRFNNDKAIAPKIAPQNFWAIVDGKAIIPAKKIVKNGRLVHSGAISRASGPLVTTLPDTKVSTLKILAKKPVASAFQSRNSSTGPVLENRTYNHKNVSRLIA